LVPFQPHFNPISTPFQPHFIALSESFDLRDGILHHNLTILEFGDCLSCAGVTLTLGETDSLARCYLGKDGQVAYEPFVRDLKVALADEVTKAAKAPPRRELKMLQGAHESVMQTEIVLPENVEGSVLVGLLRDHFYAKRNDLRQAFHAADLDNSGKLSHDELNLLMCSLGFDVTSDASKRMIHMFGEFGRATLDGGVSYDAFCKALDAEALGVTLDHGAEAPAAAVAGGGDGAAPKKKKKKSKKKKVLEKLNEDDTKILEAISNKVYQKSISFVESFTAEDENHDGIVDLNEFMAGLIAFGVEAGPGAAMHLFHVFDTHHDGRINIEEFVSMLIAGGDAILEGLQVADLDHARDLAKGYVAELTGSA